MQFFQISYNIYVTYIFLSCTEMTFVVAVVCSFNALLLLLLFRGKCVFFKIMYDLGNTVKIPCVFP